MKYGGPVVLAVLDGVGLAPDADGNAVAKARMPFLLNAARNYLHVALNASGEAVGLIAGQMGNSEVGHNTLGAGQAILQAQARVNAAFQDGTIFESEAWKEAVRWALNGGTLHFAGIFSDGGVHSDIKHLFLMIEEAYKEGVRRMRVHAVFDGRDVGPFTAEKYVQDFENFVANFENADIKIADGGGRMVYVADRYENDWEMVKKGFDVMVNGKISTKKYDFKNGLSPLEIIKSMREYDILQPIQDQFLPEFVVTDDEGEPIGKIEKGDALIYFDFRADRAIEIAQAFTYWDFPYFERGSYRPSDVYFVGMTEYNSDTHVPEHRLVEPVEFGETLHEFLGLNNISQLAVSETVKFGHITYYFDGNSYEKMPGEEFVEIESDTEPFETRPWMKSAETADVVCRRMQDFKFVRVNFPGGDMVGHTADFEATVVALEAIDLALKRIAAEVDKLGGALIITADHGNAEELLDADGRPKTAHTTNKVPLIIYDNTENRGRYEASHVRGAGLKNVAATVATMLGLTPPREWGEALIKT